MKQPPQPPEPGVVGQTPRRDKRQEPPRHELLPQRAERTEEGVRRHDPARPAPRLADDPLNVVARRGGQVDGIVRRLGSAQDGHGADVGVLGQRYRRAAEVVGVDERGVEVVEAIEGGQVGLRADAGGDDELLGADRFAAVERHIPAAVGSLGHVDDGGVEADAVGEVKVVGVGAVVVVHHLAGDVLPGLDVEAIRVHGKVGEVKGGKDVVRFEGRIQLLLGPHAANAAMGVDNEEVNVLVMLEEGFCRAETGRPSTDDEYVDVHGCSGSGAERLCRASRRGASGSSLPLYSRQVGRFRALGLLPRLTKRDARRASPPPPPTSRLP